MARLLIKRKNQKGIALILAILIIAVLMLMTYLLFAVTHFGVAIQKGQKDKFLNDVLVHRIFKDAFANIDLEYNSNLVPSSSSSGSILDSINYTVITNNSHNQNLESSNYFVIPEAGYSQGFINYYVDVNSSISEKHAVVRVPSATNVSLNHSINKSEISLNVPAVNFNNLNGAQLSSGSSTLLDTRVGYVGSVRIDNNGGQPLLIFSENGTTDHDPITLPFTDSNGLALSQGWALVDGVWKLSIAVYNH